MSGRQYSLWPVFLTTYNLPPEMCMRKELLFMSILIPGPKHPKRSLDVFLQPLIEELKELWSTGMHIYDCSTRTNFTMRAVLLWTISDFPAYGMLSGWMTHWRLSCPYCMGSTNAFQLKVVGRRPGLIVIGDFFPLIIRTEGTRNCFGQKGLYKTPFRHIYLERKSRRILINMVQKWRQTSVDMSIFR